ncbi:MAG TPA: alpha/beta hydrolase family protein [Humisphaera sp.]|nr:alpha/beta hydrolase family protein [Humisphaera sp.]
MSQPQFIRVFLLVAISASFAFAADAPAPAPEMLHDVDHPWPFEPQFKDRGEREKRADELRKQILVAEGLWPMPAKTPLNAVIHGKIEREGYTIEKVYFASMPGHYVSGNLYRPTGKTGKLPAVLFAHGHWDGGRFYENSDRAAKQEIDSGAEKWMEGAKYLLQAPCAGLARMGCIVFAYDMVGYADSTAIEHRKGFLDAEAALRLQSFMGLQSWNSVRALDFVCDLPDVDATRVAMTGASGGGTQTMILCGTDPRPAVSFPAVMVGEAMQGGCICENAYYLRLHTNNAEIASLFAPKPLGMTSANDWTKDLLTKGFPEIKSVYALYGATDNVMAWYRSFGHNYNQVSRELMYNWMNDHLQLGLASPVREQQFVPVVPPKELSVYDDAHPRPADSLGAAELRKKMTDASDAQMAELAKDPEKYRQVVEAALDVMVGSALAGSPHIGDSHTDLKGQNVEGVISSSPGGEQVHFKMLMPEKWNGTLIVWLDPQGSEVLSRPWWTTVVQDVLHRGVAIMAPDLTGMEAGNPLAKGGKYAGYTFAGYYYGYNASILSRQVVDSLLAPFGTKLLTAMWSAKAEKPIRLLATGHTGAAALLANTSGAFDRAAIDLDHFDFDQVTDPADPMMLPGALKYGGVSAFATLCKAKTAIWNPPAKFKLAVPTPTVSVQQGDAKVEKMIDWLLEP